jgi:hypothetical protein
MLLLLLDLLLLLMVRKEKVETVCQHVYKALCDFNVEKVHRKCVITYSGEAGGCDKDRDCHFSTSLHRLRSGTERGLAALFQYRVIRNSQQARAHGNMT